MKKGFTLVEVLATIVILGIVGILATGAYYKYLAQTQKKSFAIAERNFIDAVKSAYADCLSGSDNDFCNLYPNLGFRDETVYLKDLIDNRYSKVIKNPYHTNENCAKDSSYVKVTVNNKNSNNISTTYQVCLICGNKKSEGC